MMAQLWPTCILIQLDTCNSNQNNAIQLLFHHSIMSDKLIEQIDNILTKNSNCHLLKNRNDNKQTALHIALSKWVSCKKENELK